MTHIKSADAATFKLPSVTFTGMVSPKHGALQNAAWKVSISPKTGGVPHSMSREEVFLVTKRQGEATTGGKVHALKPGDSFIVPACTNFRLANNSDTLFEAVAISPVGGQTIVGDEAPFTPPGAA